MDNQTLVGKERIGLLWVSFVGTKHLSFVWQNKTIEACIAYYLIIRINVCLSREERPVRPSTVFVGRDESAFASAVDVQCAFTRKRSGDVGVASGAHVERSPSRNKRWCTIGVVVARCVCPSKIHQSTFHGGKIIVESHQLNVVEVVIHIVGVDTDVE